MGQWIRIFLGELVGGWYIPTLGFIDALEIIIISAIIYRVILWIKNTKAWMLLKGLLVLLFFIFLAYLLQMNTILFLGRQTLSVLAIVAVVVFQPELRRALEKLGERNLFSNIVLFDPKQDNRRFSSKTIEGIVEASARMSGEKTGALLVIEQVTMLSEYVNTGIVLDSIVSEQVLLNIFADHTPLHDGAVIIREDRIVAATCYLPLTENMYVSKDLGTRHRAAIGITEVSDALAIVISEETGNISVALEGNLKHNISVDFLTRQLKEIQLKSPEPKRAKGKKGGEKNETI